MRYKTARISLLPRTVFEAYLVRCAAIVQYSSIVWCKADAMFTYFTLAALYAVLEACTRIMHCYVASSRFYGSTPTTTVLAFLVSLLA